MNAPPPPQPPPEREASNLRVLFEYPGLLRWVLARLLSGTAVSMVRAAVLWQIYAITGSAAYLGLLGLVQFLPVPFVSIAGGTAADHFDRKKLVVGAQSVAFAITLVLFALTWADGLRLWLLFGLLVAFSCATSFEAPARSASLSSFVKPIDLPRAVPTFITAQSIAFMSGPVVAGFVIAHGSVAHAYGVAALLLFVSAVAVSTAKVLNERKAPPRGPAIASIKEGVRFVRNEPVLLGAMTVDLLAVIFGGAAALLPVYATDILQVGASGYGTLAASLEIGGLIASIALLWSPPIRRLGRALFVSILVFGAATIVFGISRSFPLSLAAYALSGMADQISMVVRGTIEQTRVPDALRGRVSAVNMIFIGASNQLGAAESGFVAAATTPTFSVVSGGLACIVLSTLLFLAVPRLRRFQLGAPDPEPEGSGRAEPEPVRK